MSRLDRTRPDQTRPGVSSGRQWLGVWASAAIGDVKYSRDGAIEAVRADYSSLNGSRSGAGCSISVLDQEDDCWDGMGWDGMGWDGMGRFMLTFWDGSCSLFGTTVCFDTCLVAWSSVKFVLLGAGDRSSRVGRRSAAS